MAARRPRLLAQAWAEHRIARDLAARRQLDAGPHRWATSALAAAAALAAAWVIYTVVPPLVTELDHRLTDPLPTFWLAGILDLLGALWESMSPTEKTALALIGTAAVSYQEAPSAWAWASAWAWPPSWTPPTPPPPSSATPGAPPTTT